MYRTLFHRLFGLTLVLLVALPHAFAQDFDLVLKGGHVIDPKNNIDNVTDIAIKNGKIAKIAMGIPPSSAVKTVDVTGLYVTPGLIDMHTHVFWGLQKNSYGDGDWSLQPDGFTFRGGVTTIVDAGSSGWRSFPAFKDRVIDRSQTRVLAMLNILGSGMRIDEKESDLSDMDGQKTGEMALKYPGLIVGVKSAHYQGPEWTPYEEAVKAGNIANIPVMIDFGAKRVERPLYQLLEEKLRPGDIYTHAYCGRRGEQDLATGGPGKGMWEGRKRGVYFDVGHGQSCFYFTIAIPLVKAGFVPDSISTDLHMHSMNAGMKDLLTTGNKFLAIGLPLKEVIADMTSHPAHEIKQDQLGQISVGSIADIAVLSLEHGNFRYVDGGGEYINAHDKLVCQLTLKDGKFVYDLNGRTADPWDQPASEAVKQAGRWTSLRMRSYADRLQPRPDGTMRPGPSPEWRPYDQVLPDGTVLKGSGIPKAALPLATQPQTTTAKPSSSK